MTLLQATDFSILSLPDGCFIDIDFTLPENSRPYIIKNGLSSHYPYKHIGSQLVEFDISHETVTGEFINL